MKTSNCVINVRVSPSTTGGDMLVGSPNKCENQPSTTAEKMFLGLTDTQRLDALRELCGYVENGSDTYVNIFQDDATRDWFVKCGRERFDASCFRGVLDKVFKYVDGLPK